MLLAVRNWRIPKTVKTLTEYTYVDTVGTHIYRHSRYRTAHIYTRTLLLPTISELADVKLFPASTASPPPSFPNARQTDGRTDRHLHIP